LIWNQDGSSLYLSCSKLLKCLIHLTKTYPLYCHTYLPSLCKKKYFTELGDAAPIARRHFQLVERTGRKLQGATREPNKYEL
jgi:hypothetical protein